ncbi:PAP1-domain-containing protein [Venustampulla echinocandica]|uniref:PAP1-domain-containing protein n=1 Tax=Venustampulla echinocandica TaxID=2656787 RepID=A0A370TNU2_9HELO|nr:PAP1-domain-containing protein [Venustampulla echinocandica]RDL37195.1 PAP1-domain-containing protein [Venustampulla echinocandica]
MDTAKSPSANNSTNAANPAFKLSARQEELLLAALNSNPAASTAPSNPVFAMAPMAFSESPVQAPGSGTLNGFDDSPFIDYEYDFDADGSFDYGFSNGSEGQMIGTLPGTSSDGDADTHDKRSHPDDDGDEEEGGGKRREGEDKGSKKPGRKPLTSEPTSKRKAQNRAAQRAFRERKEKHLKDLETKVEDLQKASESANHENSILRAQIDKMSVELNEYRKRISVNGGVGRSTSLNNGYPTPLSGRSLGASRGLNDPNDVNFQFEFPRFGRLPGPAPTSLNGARQSVSPSITGQQTTSPIEKQVSPRNHSLGSLSNNGSAVGLTRSPVQLDNGDMSSLSGLFSPSILKSVGKSPEYDFFGNKTSQGSNGSRSSPESGNGTGSTGHNTTYSSPSASSNSNHGPSSSCGTSPEPTMQSPVYKAADSTLTTIGEEHTSENNRIEGELTFCDKLNMACGNPNNPIPRTLSESAADSSNIDNPAFDVNGIDWFAQQNGNQFDPQLFGDYREPQDNIISGDAFGDSFFSDAFAVPDFTSPFNIEPSPAPHKKDLVQQIDEQQNEGDEEVVPAEDTTKLLNCNTIWDRLQQCPKVKEGEFDLDLLCKDLQKKAKCSETGAVVNESDFNRIMKTYVQKPDGMTTATGLN